MPTPDQIAILKKNVLGAFESSTRLQFLGRQADRIGMNAGRQDVALEDRGSVFLIAMLNEFFAVSPDQQVFSIALQRTNAFIAQDRAANKRPAWDLVQEHLLDIGQRHGWVSNSDLADSIVSDWSPEQAGEFEARIDKETGKKSGACYVATAVYGSYDCPEVWVLRRFRDQVLARRRAGRAFVRAYYLLGPLAARLMPRISRRQTRRVLDRMVGKLRDQGFADTPYAD